MSKERSSHILESVWNKLCSTKYYIKEGIWKGLPKTLTPYYILQFLIISKYLLMKSGPFVSGWFPFSNFSAFTSPEMNELYLNWKLGIDKRYRISRCLFVVCSVCRPLNCRLDMWGSPPASKFGWTLIRDIWYLGGLSLARKSVCDVIADLTRWVYPPVWAHPHQAATQRWGWTIGNHNQFKIKMKNCLTIFFKRRI